MTDTLKNTPYLDRPLRSEEEARRQLGKACSYCEGEPEPGYIEMPNNGPIVPCPVCNKGAGHAPDHR